MFVQVSGLHNSVPHVIDCHFAQTCSLGQCVYLGFGFSMIVIHIELLFLFLITSQASVCSYIITVIV